MEKNLLDELLEINQTAEENLIANSEAILEVSPPNTLPVKVKADTEIEVHDPIPTSPQDDDIAFARKKMRSIIKAAEEAFSELANIANETQQPRAYEVLATLLKTTTDATKELVTIHRTKAEIKKIEQFGLSTAFDKSNLTQVNQNIEKAVFVGTAPEMLDRIEKQKLSQVEVIEDDNDQRN